MVLEWHYGVRRALWYWKGTYYDIINSHYITWVALRCYNDKTFIAAGFFPTCSDIKG